MNVVAQDGGLASIILIADETKPEKGVNLPRLLSAVHERYSFVKAPNIQEAREHGAKFQNGVFRSGKREIAIGELGLFNDAFTVATTDTSDSELVLDDCFAWLKKDFAYRDQSRPYIRTYQSDLICKFDNDPGGAFANLKGFFEFLQKNMIPEASRAKKPVEFSGIAFGADPSGAGASPEFTLFRRVSVPWHLGLWFSKAHLTTANHIKALAMIDELLGGSKS